MWFAWFFILFLLLATVVALVIIKCKRLYHKDRKPGCLEVCCPPPVTGGGATGVVGDAAAVKKGLGVVELSNYQSATTAPTFPALATTTTTTTVAAAAAAAAARQKWVGKHHDQKREAKRSLFVRGAALTSLNEGRIRRILWLPSDDRADSVRFPSSGDNDLHDLARNGLDTGEYAALRPDGGLISQSVGGAQKPSLASHYRISCSGRYKIKYSSYVSTTFAAVILLKNNRICDSILAVNPTQQKQIQTVGHEFEAYLRVDDKLQVVIVCVDERTRIWEDEISLVVTPLSGPAEEGDAEAVQSSTAVIDIILVLNALVLLVDAARTAWARTANDSERQMVERNFRTGLGQLEADSL